VLRSLGTGKRRGKMEFTLKEWCKENKIKVSPQVKRAADFLESKGYDFLVDFGYENAEKIAREKYNFNAVEPSRKTLNGMVLRIMRGKGWMTPWAIQASLKVATGVHVCDSSVKSRIRDLRLPEYGCHLIDKRKIVDSNAYEYRLVR
jgi:hypothetical protein